MLQNDIIIVWEMQVSRLAFFFFFAIGVNKTFKINFWVAFVEVCVVLLGVSGEIIPYCGSCCLRHWKRFKDDQLVQVEG